MSLSVKLPCKPLVYQYIINRYGSPVVFPSGDWLKLLVSAYLNKQCGHFDSQITLQYYTKEIALPLSMEDYEDTGDQLSKTAIRAINNRIEELVHERLSIFLEFYVHVANYSLKDAIYLFQELNALPEEVFSSDAIKKHYQRKIQPNLNPIKFIGVNVPFKQKKVYTLRSTVEKPAQ